MPKEGDMTGIGLAPSGSSLFTQSLMRALVRWVTAGFRFVPTIVKPGSAQSYWTLNPLGNRTVQVRSHGWMLSHTPERGQGET